MSTKKQQQYIEFRVIEKYQADDGDWVFDAGKITEGKLLKECVVRIQELKKTCENIEKHRDDILAKLVKYENEIFDIRNQAHRFVDAVEQSAREYARAIVSNNYDVQNKISKLEKLIKTGVSRKKQ